MTNPKRPIILFIMGSVRAGRRCPQITNWVREIAERSDALACETIDLRDWPLPADDEPEIPAKGIYAHEHTRAWSAKIAGADGFVVVSPQYNWGYPAPLKNALDHLYKEWIGKPLAIITYGGHGGDKCAMQLQQVASGLKLHVLPTMPSITISREAIESEKLQTLDELYEFSESVHRVLNELRKALLAVS